MFLDSIRVTATWCKELYIMSTRKELSKEVDLKPGDLIFTGTPAGVGKIKRGDKENNTCSTEVY